MRLLAALLVAPRLLRLPPLVRKLTFRVPLLTVVGTVYELIAEGQRNCAGSSGPDGKSSGGRLAGNRTGNRHGVGQGIQGCRYARVDEGCAIQLKRHASRAGLKRAVAGKHDVDVGYAWRLKRARYLTEATVAGDVERSTFEKSAAAVGVGSAGEGEGSGVRFDKRTRRQAGAAVLTARAGRRDYAADSQGLSGRDINSAAGGIDHGSGWGSSRCTSVSCKSKAPRCLKRTTVEEEKGCRSAKLIGSHRDHTTPLRKVLPVYALVPVSTKVHWA